ncbi:MAG TPA: ABC transporter permease [Vicinamibacterales bacterium]|nr:ABC transporter permease [Vicinamibacterales bacterium]
MTAALSTTVFGVVDGVLFKSLPFRSPDRMYIALGADASGRVGSLAPDDLESLRRADPRIAIAAVGRAFRLTSVDRPDLTIWAREIDPQFFDVVGEHPALGAFTNEDFLRVPARMDARPAIVTEALCRRVLGDEVARIGQVVDMLGQRLRVVGILPKDFVFPVASNYPTDVLLPLVIPETTAANLRTRNLSEGLVRLRAEISLREASARLDAALRSTQREHATTVDASGAYVAVDLKPVTSFLGRDSRPVFVVAFVGALLLVLLGAINVTALSVARVRDRGREFAVRVALGARRRDLIGMQLSEASLIAVAGGAVGLALVRPALNLVVRLLPADLVLLKEPAVDGRVAAFAFLAAVLPLVLVALTPAITAARRAVLSAATGYRVAGGTRAWPRNVLLLIESSIGIILLLAGSLVVAGFILMRTEDMGLASARLALVEIRPVGPATSESTDVLLTRAYDRLQTAPGVRAVAMVGTFVLERILNDTQFDRPAGSQRAVASDVPIAGAFFDIAGLQLVDGRLPTREELATQQRLAVVSQTVANAYWPGRQAVGQTLQGRGLAVTVIGVVSNARWAAQSEGPDHGQIYLPAGLTPANRTVYLLATVGDPESVARTAGAALKRDVPGALVRRAESLDEAVSSTVRYERFAGVLFGVAGGSALLIVAIGVAGLAATGAARRRQEMAIRIALGSTRARLVRSVVLGQLHPVIVGVGAGLLASWWISRLVGAYVYQLHAHDVRIWATAAGAILVAAASAAWLPAQRASSVDPAATLRAE